MVLHWKDDRHDVWVLHAYLEHHGFPAPLSWRCHQNMSKSQGQTAAAWCSGMLPCFACKQQVVHMTDVKLAEEIFRTLRTCGQDRTMWPDSWHMLLLGTQAQQPSAAAVRHRLSHKAPILDGADELFRNGQLYWVCISFAWHDQVYLRGLGSRDGHIQRLL